jgi:hypothetical protein
MYLTFEDYTNFGGKLNETTFNDLEFGAETVIDYYTFNRLKRETQYPEELKRCVFALIKIAKLQEDALSLGQTEDGTSTSSITSQSNDGVSISYNAMSASEAYQMTDKQVEKTIKMYLGGVVNTLGHRLLYRGVYPDE